MKRFLCLLLVACLLFCTTAIAEDWTCPSCGYQTSGNFCSNCGAPKPADVWICPKCGNKVSGNFCNNCGTPKPSADEVVDAFQSDSQTAKAQKDGFDSTTNDRYYFSQYSAEIPSYWINERRDNEGIQSYAETGGKFAILKISAIYDTDEDYPVTFDGLMQDIDNMQSSIEATVVSEVTDREIIDTGYVKGILFTGRSTNFQNSGVGISVAWFTFASEQDRYWCHFICVQSDNTEYLYDDDFLKIINSIRPATVTPATPANVPEETAIPTLTNRTTDDISADALQLLENAKSHTRTRIAASPDKYTHYIQDYVGLNLSSIGYTSLGGDRLDRYGAGLLKIYPITLDGTYIDIEDEDALSQFLVVAQSITPNSELKLTYRKDSKGNEYSNLIDYQSIDSIDLLVVRLDGTTTGNVIPYAPVAIKPAPDRYTAYIRNYVGKNLATVGYTSLGGDRLDEYHAARIELCIVTEDGTYIDIEDSDLLQQYVIIGQNIAPNTEVKIVYQKDSKGKENDNLVDFCSIGVIDLHVRRIDGVKYNDTVSYSPISITASRDKYTWYIRNYVGKNLASFGYTSLGGDRMDEYGNARIEFVLITPDRSVVDIDDIEALATWIVVDQDVEPNSVMTVTYQKNSKGEEYANLIESVTYKKITLTLQQVNPIPEPEPPAALGPDLPATTAAPVTSRFEGATQNYRDFSYIVQSDDTAVIVGYSGNSSSVSIPSDMNGHGVSGIGPSVFENHTEIASVAMWADATFIGERAFMGCTKLKDISISSDCTSIGASAFEGCTKLQSAALWGDPEIGDRAFYGCTSLKEISIGSDTELIGVSAFEGCTDLKTVIIWGGTNISDRAFCGCTSIKELNIDSDTEYIGDYAFYGCTSLKEVTIWGSGTRIGTEAFGNCPKLNKINQW